MFVYHSNYKSSLLQVLTLPGLEVEENIKKKAADKWAISHCLEKKQDVNEQNIMDSLQECLYVYRDDSASHRLVLGAFT